MLGVNSPTMQNETLFCLYYISHCVIMSSLSICAILLTVFDFSTYLANKHLILLRHDITFEGHITFQHTLSTLSWSMSSASPETTTFFSILVSIAPSFSVLYYNHCTALDMKSFANSKATTQWELEISAHITNWGRPFLCHLPNTVWMIRQLKKVKVAHTR